jgi:hypothetical protein
MPITDAVLDYLPAISVDRDCEPTVAETLPGLGDSMDFIGMKV